MAAIMLSFIAIMVDGVGMRCTTCMAEQPEQKDKVALTGGVIFIIAGKEAHKYTLTHIRTYTIQSTKTLNELICL